MPDAFNSYLPSLFTEDNVVIKPFIDSLKSGTGNITMTQRDIFNLLKEINVNQPASQSKVSHTNYGFCFGVYS